MPFGVVAAEGSGTANTADQLPNVAATSLQQSTTQRLVRLVTSEDSVVHEEKRRLSGMMAVLGQNLPHASIESRGIRFCSRISRAAVAASWLSPPRRAPASLERVNAWSFGLCPPAVSPHSPISSQQSSTINQQLSAMALIGRQSAVSIDQWSVSNQQPTLDGQESHENEYQ